MQNIVSGLFNSAYAMGGITGPMFGGYVTSATSFKTTAEIQGLIMFALASFQLIIVLIPS